MGTPTIADNTLAREKCRAEHRAQWHPTNGFGWRGSHCHECGLTHFGEWEDWAKDSLSSRTSGAKDADQN